MKSHIQASALAFATFLSVQATADIFDNATISGHVSSFASISDGGAPVTQSDNVPISSGFGGIDITSRSNVSLAGGSYTSTTSVLLADFTLTTAYVRGYVSCDSFRANGTTSCSGDGSISLQIAFTIPQGQSFDWSFTSGSAGGSNSSPQVILKAGPTVLFDSATDLDFNWTNNTGTLAAGTYSLETTVSALTDTFAYGTFGYDFVLTGGLPPCPADFNQDGAVDFFDYDEFVTCFEGLACPPGVTADFNNDTAVDFFDYDEFVVAFETPC
ncbi:MAG: hypothetical protein AABZ53_11815 [Planctomycetota bacterium]